MSRRFNKKNIILILSRYIRSKTVAERTRMATKYTRPEYFVNVSVRKEHDIKSVFKMYGIWIFSIILRHRPYSALDVDERCSMP